MNLLDDLQKALDYEFGRAEFQMWAWNDLKEHLRKALDTFAAQHPGLVDRTRRCEHCGAIYVGRYWCDGSCRPYDDGWGYIETHLGDHYLDCECEHHMIWLVCPECLVLVGRS